MKVYTRTGDAGTTSLVGGTRVSKCSPRLEAYGTVDELNSHIGLLLTLTGDREITTTLTEVQNRLFDLGAELATEENSRFTPRGITDSDVCSLETAIDAIEATLPRHNRFILPGGTQAAAQANVCRTVCRRCERRMVEMAEQGCAVAPAAMRYINRLSDYLFVASRALNVRAGATEVFWGD